MEIKEDVAPLETFTDPDTLCQGEEEPQDPNWTCRINKWGEESAPTAKRLNDNMRTDEVFLPDDPLPKKGGHWDLTLCTNRAFPYQSHHLIPKMHLPEHDVCRFLAKKAKGDDYALISSTNYDTDNSLNGLSLPFASNTYEWKHAKNAAEEMDICKKMMDQTGRQLHQGSHTYDDYGEQDGLHSEEEVGYLGACDELMNVISDLTKKHVDKCKDCNKGTESPRKIRPLERVVDAMYEASSIMSSIIAGNKRFVSERAAIHLGSGGIS